jgi:hypothetical protein
LAKVEPETIAKRWQWNPHRLLYERRRQNGPTNHGICYEGVTIDESKDNRQMNPLISLEDSLRALLFPNPTSRARSKRVSPHGAA